MKPNLKLVVEALRLSNSSEGYKYRSQLADKIEAEGVSYGQLELPLPPPKGAWMTIPPKSIMKAALQVSEWFKSHGITNWRLCGVQNSSEPNQKPVGRILRWNRHDLETDKDKIPSGGVCSRLYSEVSVEELSEGSCWREAEPLYTACDVPPEGFRMVPKMLFLMEPVEDSEDMVGITTPDGMYRQVRKSHWLYKVASAMMDAVPEGDDHE